MSGNSVNETPSQELTSERPRSNRNERCCSFCYRADHNIRRCNDSKLNDFENFCNIKRDTLNIFEYPNVAFRRWLLEIYLENFYVIRAFAVSRCGCRLNSTSIAYIDNITLYFYPQHNEYLREREENLRNQAANDIIYQNVLREFINIVRDVLFNTQNDEPMNPHHTNINYENRRFNIETTIDTNCEEHLDSLCECSICWESIEKVKFVKLGCGHEFCKDCLKQSIKSDTREVPLCSYCRSEIKHLTSRSVDIDQELGALVEI